MISTSGLHVDQAPPLHIPFRFFATAPLFMIFAGVVLFLWQGDLFLAPLVPQTVALVHLAVLGWITMVMVGALYQMFPVLAGVPVPWPGLVPWVHGLLIFGLVSMFLGIGADGHAWWLLAASVGLGPAVGLFLIQIYVALFRAATRHPSVWAMGISSVALASTLAMGAVFLGEYAHGFMALDREAMVGIHLTWGLLGWIGTLIMGVSFQVLPMFYMMPEFPTRAGGWILAGVSATLLLLPAALYLYPETPDIWWLAGGPGLIAVGFYSVITAKLLVRRKRTYPDLTFRFWQLGFLSGALSLLVLATWPAQEGEAWRFLFGVLFIMGWATSVILGMLYKIVPFLVWFHRFSNLAGLVEIPMMDDLVPEKVARVHFIAHTLSVVLLSLAAGLGYEWAIPAGGVALGVSGVILAYSIWFAWRQEPPEAPEMPDFDSFFKPGGPLDKGNLENTPDGGQVIS
ncbi:MAG: hypothetical protein HQL52_16615 [Magnetococcales bacterium]|nr:hypothetical protein [Magnetococcales bacterium]